MKVCLDSRLIKSGEYFVPIIGENFDGHRFVEQALQNGAEGIIEEHELYKIASEKLSKISPKVIAVTGSVGKTTVSNYLFTMLSTKHKVCLGSLNTKLGLATNIINELQEDDEFFVAETGMDYSGELTETGKFINPDLAIITNISESHMEKLGSLEAIKHAKAELLTTIKPSGIAVLNWDNSSIAEIGTNPEILRDDVKLVKYGLDNKLSDYSRNDLPSVELHVFGEHNISNIVCSIATCEQFGFSQEDVINSLPKIRSAKGRLNRIDGINDSIIIDDTYNSSPVSCKYALESVAKYYNMRNLNGRKIAVLGGMLELGDYEDKAHSLVGDYVVENKFDVLITVGDIAKKLLLSRALIDFGLEIIELESNIIAGEYIKNKLDLSNGDIILVKGSQQGIRLEKTVELIMKNPKEARNLLVRQDERWE